MPYLKTMVAMTGPAGMMPEQVWDDQALPELRLFPGEPTGSAMPLAWAHAEFIKLMVSRHLGYPVDRSPDVWARYAGRRPDAKQAVWCLHAPIGRIAKGIALVIALPRAATVRWGTNGWQNPADLETHDTGLGMHAVELDRARLAAAGVIDFTVRWHDGGAWLGQDFHVAIDA
jgi:glucoamylase